MSTTLILLAYAFPPENASGAARPYRFFRYLPEFGITPRVITASPQVEAHPDIAFVRDVPRDFPRTTLAWQAERIVRKTLLPGEVGLTWSRAAAARAVEWIPAQGRAVVLSTSPPSSAHLAALRVKKLARIPWIADFRDPMYLNKNIAVLSRVESFLLHRTDAVIANTDTFCTQLGEMYPKIRRKLTFIWNGFDPMEKIAPEPLPSRPFRRLVHVGEIYGGRHPGPILDSLQRLLAGGTLRGGSLRLSLIGTLVDGAIPNMDVLQQLVEAGAVELVPTMIPRPEARRVASEADALVLLQPQTDTQVPAKLFEYIRIGRPILAYVRRNSPSERILEGSGIPYRSIYPEDTPQQVDAKLLDFLSLPTEPTGYSAWFAGQFDARRQAQALAAIIEALP